MPSTGEWMVLLVVGLLIFGRRLPEVGRSVARTMTHFRRGLQDFKQEMDKDEDLKDIKSTVSDLKKTIDAPRILANPGKYLDRLADEPDEPEQAPEVEPEQAPEVEPARKELPAQGVGVEEEGEKEEEKA